jgi:hypothetical protein
MLGTPCSTRIGFAFFLRLDLQYKTKRCRWDIIHEQNNYYLTRRAEKHLDERNKCLILPTNLTFKFWFRRAEQEPNLLAIHMIDKVSFLTDCSDGQMPQQVLRVALYNSEYTYCPTMHAMSGYQHYASRVVCVLQRFRFSYRSKLCGIVQCDCLHCIRCYYYGLLIDMCLPHSDWSWIVNVIVKLDIIG